MSITFKEYYNIIYRGTHRAFCWGRHCASRDFRRPIFFAPPWPTPWTRSSVFWSVAPWPPFVAVAASFWWSVVVVAVAAVRRPCLVVAAGGATGTATTTVADGGGVVAGDDRMRNHRCHYAATNTPRCLPMTFATPTSVAPPFGWRVFAVAVECRWQPIGEIGRHRNSGGTVGTRTPCTVNLRTASYSGCRTFLDGAESPDHEFVI